MNATATDKQQNSDLRKLKVQIIKGLGDNSLFRSLIQISFCDLSEHYKNLRAHLWCAFGSATTIGLVAIGIIIYGTRFLVRTEDLSAASVVIGAGILLCIGAVICFYWYHSNISKVTDFGQKLLLIHNMTLALKTADQLRPEPQEKNAELSARRDIVKELLQDINKLLAAGPSDGPSRR